MTASDSHDSWPLRSIQPQRFLQQYWQRKPLLLRQALPGMRPPLSRDQLFALAADDAAESRLVVREGEQWSVEHGPFARRQLPSLKTPDWTLLVQGVDLLDDGVAALLERFRFIPDARLDDIMISWASEGGGVGPHVDDYDVFLIQVEGQRLWRIGPVADASMRPGQPLKLLQHFEPDEEFLVEPGDILYLPPGWGHDGVAMGGSCMTYSVGFRAPPADELLRQLLWKLADELEPMPRYSDRGVVSGKQAPARLPAEMVDFLQKAWQSLKPGRTRFERALAEMLTEPKQQVWFDPSEQTPRALRAAIKRHGLRLDRRSRMLYAARLLVINGDSVCADLQGSRLLRCLADQRRLSALDWGAASPEEQAQLLDWALQGWLHPAAT